MLNKTEAGRGHIKLVPDEGVEIIDGQTAALSSTPWLRVEPAETICRRGWFCLRYSSSFFDDGVRPRIRFTTGAGDAIVYPMNGAVLGSAEWLGRVPRGTTQIHISPTNRPGPFGFRIDSVASMPWWVIAKRAVPAPMRLASALRAFLIGAREEAVSAIAGAAPTSLGQYDRWCRRLQRNIDIDGFDRPSAAWDTTPRVKLFLSLGHSQPVDLAPTIESLRAQVYPHWSLNVITDANASQAALAELARACQADARIVQTSRDRLQATSPPDAEDIVATISAGDVFPRYALAVVADQFVRHVEWSLAYGDEDAIGPNGVLHSPQFKVDWSPIAQAGRHYVGGPTWIRYRALPENGLTGIDHLFEAGSVITGKLERDRVGHIRRILSRRRSEPRARERDAASTKATSPRSLVISEERNWPRVAVIVPTRDQPHLLSECVRGLREVTDYPSVEVILVDNGSTDASARRLLDDLKSQRGFHVLEFPGPFNYSALCNAGAGASNAPMLVFLNNDVAMVDRAWLKALVALAVKPDIGVVGAKLLDAKGEIQHAGVVLGLGGVCGHIYRGAPAGELGYLGELQAAREVTAVTGACIAVERAKFDAVGGFDSDNLPVELNDIDLCLRMTARGWTNIWTPHAVLRHLEAASRGTDLRSSITYQKERHYFIDHWSHRICDDAYFHPALSLYSLDPALA